MEKFVRERFERFKEYKTKKLKKNYRFFCGEQRTTYLESVMFGKQNHEAGGLMFSISIVNPRAPELGYREPIYSSADSLSHTKSIPGARLKTGGVIPLPGSKIIGFS